MTDQNTDRPEPPDELTPEELVEGVTELLGLPKAEPKEDPKQ